MTKTVRTISSFLALIIVLLTTSNAAAQQIESLYVDTSTSTRAITSETNSRGAADGLESSISGNLGTGHTWTFSFDNSSYSGLPVLGADIYITHRQIGLSNDNIVLEYFDGTNWTIFEDLANATGTLATYGPFTTTLTTTTQLDNFQLRLRGDSKTGPPDGIDYYVDAVELRANIQTNVPPVLNSIGAQSVTEGQLLSFTVTASDPNGTDPAMLIVDRPINASYTDNGDGTGSFSWTPLYTEAGSYNVTFIADDGQYADSELVVITVNEAGNQAPVVSDIPDQAVAEGSSFAIISLDNYVDDPDNIDSEISWSYAGNTELSVSIDGSRFATVTIPSADWNGSETITFTATDPGLLTDNDAATFTVTAVNDAPVVANIPDQAIAEGASFATISLDDYVSDVDNLDSEISWTYAGNSALTVSIDGSRVATITIPSADWNGSETITFTATDLGLLTDNDAATFTVTAVNDAPVVADIPDQSIAEGSAFATVDLDTYVSDVDNPDSEMSWTYAGNTELTVSIDVNRVATITIPNADWNGNETITFTATDPGLLTDNDAATFTVTAVNDAPVVADIPDQSIAEGSAFATVDLDTYVSDVDNLDSEMSWTYAGNTELTVSIDVNRVATITIPNADWNGNETITFTATDPGLLADNDAATFTVTAVNDAPVVADIPDQSIAEGSAFATVDLDTYVSDVDNLDSEMSWTYAGNTELTVSIDVNRIATITIPDSEWNGSETITFTATDPGLLTDNDAATFTVTAVNDAPIVADIPDQVVAEGGSFATVSLDDYVSDVDNIDSEISWTYSGNTELTVSIDVNRVATITIPSAQWNGSETITFTATDPGLLTDNDAAAFTVTVANDPPIVTDIPDQTIAEGSTFTTISLDDYVSDVDNIDSEISWTYSGNTELTVSIDVNRVATITIPSTDWFGNETITFTATDPGLLSDSDPATFTVTNINDAPIVADIADQTIAEGSTFATVDLDSYVSDVDNLDNEISWGYSGNSELTVSIDVNRVATITIPDAEWSGSETITFTATDPGLLTDNDAATFTVNAVNDAPIVTDIPDQTVSEGSSFATISLDDFVSDADNLDSELSWSYAGNTELTVSIDVNRVATITIPDTEWSGSETITFTATDPGLLADSDPAVFTVTAVNDAPVVADIPDQTIAEGAVFATVDLDTYVSDIDNLDNEISWSYAGNTELTVSIDVNRIATITIPSTDWNGAETITFTATDPGLLTDDDAATFTVTAVNDAPVVADIPDQSITEGNSFATIDLDSYVSDVDDLDSDISWTYSGNTELTVSIDVNRVATITIPSTQWNGSETITFTATDPGLLSDNDAATFTVTAFNDPPVVADIPDQSISEGASFATISLDNYVSDLDNLDSEISWTYSGNTELTVSIDVNRVATITIPSTDWFGNETITFTATDPGLASDSDPATFAVTNVNDAPIVADIPDQTIDEGASFATISLDSYVSDVDNLDNEISWTYSGNTELTVSIDVNRVATITIPDAEWSGAETITFTATDPGLLTDNDAATFTVNAVNDAPVVADIPDQTVDEGASFATISLDSYVSDIDNADSEISWSYSGNTELTVSIDVNRIATITIPDAEWSGSETITFTATDPGLLADADAATFTVNSINDIPVVSDIPDQTIAEGTSFATISLDDYVDDVDNIDSDISWTYSGNTELTVSIDVNRIATITIPSTDWNGAETITFTATDPGLLTDNDAATFTVTAINDAPIVADIPDQTIIEGGSFATVNLDDYVSDVDNIDSDISWTYSGNTELTVSIDVNRIATITIPGTDWNGAETITFTATDPGLLADNDAATFTVTAFNDPPVVADISDQTIAEGSTFATISLDDYVADPDNIDSEMSWTYSGNSALSVSIDVNRVATITTPSADWNGAETITFTATDPGLLSDSDPATFTVTAVNDAPVVADIGDQTIAEGSSFATISLDNFVSDIDNLDSEISWTYTGNTELTVSIDVNRVATITIPDINWNGSEAVTFTATDPGLLADSDPVTFTVTAVNDAPIVSDIPDQTVAEGTGFATISLDTYVTDIDNLVSEISWSYSGNTELTVSIDVNRIATITAPNADWNGNETITFTATDPGLLFDADAATFTVTGVNDAPIVSDIPDQTIAEGATFASVNLDNYVTDIDNLASEITWTYSGNTELTVSIVNRIANVIIPNADWNGNETITFTATDPGLLADSDPATFTVTAVNDAPIAADIPDQTIAEGSTFTTVSLDDFVSDVDNLDNEISWTYSGNSELTVSIDVNRIATITIPDIEWSGAETITFTATDPGLLADSDPATFTVTAVNDAPIVTDIPDQTIAEGASFTTIDLDSYVSDIDNVDSDISWSYSGNTELTVSIDVNRVATISIPNADWNGSETITFTATDPGLLFDADPATFTVNAVNDAPVVADIPDQTIAEGASFATIDLDSYVSDVDNLDSEIAWTYAGNTELTVSIDVNRVATITIPDTEWSGSETITFTATDPGLLADNDAATFTVTAVNDAPVVTDIPDQTIAEGSSFTAINLDSYVSDIDNLISELTWSYSGNVELSVSIVNNVAIISVPNSDWTGSESITFTATDPGLAAGADIATFTVTNVNDAPIVSDIPGQTVAEGGSFATISLDDYVSDIDNIDSEISWTYAGNTELTVSIDVNRIATITIPSANWNGSETITFTATDPGLLNSSDPATFTVTATDDAPIVTDIPDQTIAEGASFATISLDDYVSDPDNLDSEISWTYSGNTELTVSIDVNRVATITIPDADWNGSELITFTATDPTLLSNSDAATFTVTAVNDAPVVADIPDQTIPEGSLFATINLDAHVSDIDNLVSDISWSYSGNTDLTVSIDVNRVATINIPNADWTGAETITFTAADPGLLTDGDAATFTVTNINDAPVISNIPDQTVAEGSSFATVNLDDFVSDIDNLDSEISWTYSGNAALTVSIDVNRVATITAPDADWNGSEEITFTATDPGLLFDNNAATFTVTAVNDAPIVADIPDQTIAEGSSFTTINLDNYVTDVDDLASDMTWTASGNTELSVSIVNRLAIITIPSSDWTGSETITFTATDPGLLNDSDPATFTVTAVNDGPIVSNIPDQTIAEGSNFATINLDDYVTDIDNLDAEMSWSYVGNTALTVSIDINRVATISVPSADWNGSETITFTASDPGLLSDSDPATFTVTGINDAPVVADIPDQSIIEGASFATISLDNFVTDTDNLDSEISWSYSGTTELTVSIDINRVATISTPNADWSGSETITFTATDPGLLFDSDAATFTVTAENDAPVVTNIPDQSVAEGATFTTIDLDNFVSDIDNLDSEMSWSYSGNTQLTVSIDINRVATITIPGADWNGSETITFTATDPGLLSDSDPATFTVTGVNDAPIVTDIPNQTIAEGGSFAAITLDNYVSDIDNLDNEISWTYSGNTELTVSIDVNRVVTITTPSPTWNGAETITFTATDPGLLADSDPATFTVSAVNNAPIVSDIPNQTVAEGSSFTTINLDNFVTDIDNLDSEISWSYSGNTELTVSIDVNRVATITIPNADWNGSEQITFTATDPSLLSNSDAATFTVTAINDAPVVADIPNQTVSEGSSFTTINLDDYVTDVDNLASDMSWSYSGNVSLSISIVNRVAIISPPDGNWNGSEVITFTATDPGLLNDSDPAQFTVTAVNDAPIVTDIPDQTIAEGATFVTINLDSYVSDVDNLDSEMDWSFIGNTALSISLDVNRVATITIPSADWNGSETITFTATDPGLLSDGDPATFTVTAVNDGPIVTDIPDQTVAEGANFATVNLDNYVSDVDNADSEIAWTYAGNTELTVSIDVNRIATITIPSAQWNGSETITFTATDPGLLSDSDPATFTVTSVNNAPIVSNIPDQVVVEGASFATLSLDNFVSDVDNIDSEISWSYSGNTELTVSIDVNRVATITIPNTDWNGSETITFTATDPGLLSDSDPASFTVTAVNDAPIVSDIPGQTVSEGGSFAQISLDNYVSDVDNLDNQISWSYTGNTELTVSIDINRVATITIPSATWNGAETITFTATDPGLLTDSDPATFTVTAVDNAPIVSDIPDQTVAEGSNFTTINLDNYVADPDNLDSEINWTYSGNTELTVSIDVNRVATVTIPSADWNGSEQITFTATDPSLLSNSDPAIFTVTAINDAPIALDIPNQTVAEGVAFATINLDDYVTDIDNLASEMTWSYSGNVALSVSIVNRVAIVSTPSSDWNGTEAITFTVTDPGLLNDSDPVTFTVTAVNDAPIVTNIPNQTIAEGATFATIDLDSYVSDVDNLDSEIGWSFEGQTALTVSVDVNRVATIIIPNADWNGSETITFTATDPGLLFDSDGATFTVTAANDAPIVSDIPDQTIAEGSTFATINLDNYVTDIDNLDSEIGWTYSGNTELTVSIDGSRVATIALPNPEWNGNETITFTATDPGLLSDSDPATFTVTAVNDAPVVTNIPDQTIAEGASFATINLDSYVTDLDNLDNEISWSYSGNTDLTVSIDINRVATITTPDANWNGSETITFTATDPGLLTDSDPATFTVSGDNDSPVVTDIPDQTIAEGASFATINLDDYVSDIDNLDNEISWTYAGNTELTVSIDVNRVATITIPNTDWNGSESITFTATDPGLLSDSDPATFTVTAVNDAPVVADIPAQTIAEGATFTTISLDGYVADIDNIASEMNWSYSGNTELTVSIDINRVATITIPNADWNGSETITFTATDPGLLSDSDPAAFTVTGVNDAPIVTDIPNQTIAEGASFTTITLDNYVSDVDNLDNQMTWSYTGNTELTVSIDVNRVVTITTPSPTWNGAETITFTATDPGLLSDSDPATFTVSAVNNAPVVSDIPNQTVAEGSSFTTINLDSYVTDIDNLDSEISWSYSGNTELTVSIDVNRVATITIPNADWNGSEQITFTATDPSLLSNSDAATFTVTAINDAPLVSDIPNQTVSEGTAFATVNLDDYVTDVDNLASDMSWSYSGDVSLIVSIVNRVAIISPPNGDWNGSEVITFTATDPGLLNDSDPAQFTITAVNDAPIVTTIPDQTIAEGEAFVTFDLDDYVSDVDNLDSEMDWSFVGNTSLTISLDVNRVATISIPNADWNGSETITFRATDPGLLFDSEAATFTVTAVNDGPVVTDIPDQTVAEGASFATVSLDNYVSDVDNIDSEIAWTYAGNTELTVSIDVNRVATITIPGSNWNGSELITFTATDPGLLSDSDPATFTVTSVNNAPVVSNVPDQIIVEGASFTTLSLDNFVSDVDNLDSEISWSYSGNTELTVAIDINRVATITIPNTDWNGSETITFTATDPGLLSDSDPATFTVTAVNDAPVVADIPDQTIAEGGAFATISLDSYVSDVDNLDNQMSWSYTGNTELTVSIDVNRVATITIPTSEWNGSETITFTATDPGLLSDSDPATFTVSTVNDAPIVADIPNQTVAEGSSFTTINLDNYVTDADNLDSEISWTYSGNTELTVAIDVNRVATITIPNANWNGSEQITFTATDPSLLSNSDPATFTVTPINDAPVIADIPNQTVAEGSGFTAINLDDYVTDIDNLASEMSWSYSGNVSLSVSIVNRVAIISTPSADWNGTEAITFTVTDPGLLNDSDPATFTVTAVNDAPIVSDIPDQTVAEGATFATIDLDAYVADVDNLDSEIGWSFTGQTSLTVSVDVNRVATVTIPSTDWNGSETITFTATDPGLLSDSDPATFTVTSVNDAPVLAAIGSQSTTENVNLSFGVSATDIDASTPVLTTSTRPAGANFTDNGDGTGLFSWTPTFDDSGSYVITFYATDEFFPADVDSELVTITVINVNREPVLSTIGAQSIDENNLLSFNTGAVDPDGNIPIMTSSTVPAGASYTDNLDGTGTFSWTPTFADSGTYIVTFYATDQFFASSVDSEVVTITVNNTNQLPILNAVGPQGTTENSNLNFVVTSSDPDGDTPAMTAANLPLGASFNDNFDGTGTFDWTPTFGDEGVYQVTFYATDAFYPADVDSEIVTITISNTNRAPISDAGLDQSGSTVGSLITLDGTGSSDPDNDALNFSWIQIGGPAVTLSSATDSTPTFAPVTPGSYQFELTVDDGLLSSSPDSVTIDIINAAPPAAVTDLAIQITTDALEMTWSAVVLDSDGLPTTVDHYVIYRGTTAYFAPTPTDSIGGTATAITTFTDNNVGGADVVGDSLTNYFYVVEAVDAFGNRSALSNRVGEFDYQITTTATTDFSLIGIPFTNSGIVDADDLIAAIGAGNVATVNNYVVASQSFESRFAAGFGSNFAVVPGKVYQVNAINTTIFSIAGNVPDPGTITYNLQTTATTDFNYLMIPFELESSFSVAQDLINSIPGTLNTLNNFVAASQSYQSRFAAGFGTNFAVRAGVPYQGNVASNGAFPAP